MKITCNDNGCPVELSSECVFYEGSVLPVTGINTNDNLQLALQKIEDVISTIEGGGGSGDAIWGSIEGTITNQTDLINYLSSNYLSQASAASLYVPLGRTLTINGITQDLSTNRTWNITGGVSSVSGTLDRISISGTSSDPIVDISANYVGQATINTVGTISIGTWQGSVIGSNYGGAGAVNGLLKANGSGIVSQAIPGVDYSNASNLLIQSFIGDGTEDTFTVTNGTIQQILLVEIGGIIQRLSTDYTVTGQDVIFADAPDSGVIITVYYFQDVIVSAPVFDADITVVLSGGKTIGKYTNGQTIPTLGKSIQQVLEDIAIEYVAPSWTSFSVTGQSTTVEVGTTLSGSKTFTWNINNNSGIVTTIDIYDNTAAATLVAGTPNDGSQVATITTIQLNSNGATQSWKGIANNVSPPGIVNSANFVVTSRFYYFYGPSASSPANSAAVRALPSSAFRTGSTSFVLNTGISLTKFVVALPPSVTITSVIDTTALNANITSDYVLTGTVNVLDAGGTARLYNIYEMNIGAPYAPSHAHLITIS